MKRVLLFLAPLLLTSIGYGQTVLATVTGIITDGTGAVIANAPVLLHNADTGQAYTAASSDTGNFTVSQVAIGDYDLTITAPGFKTYTHTKFHLSAGQTMREDVRMEVGQATQSVTVTAEASQLQADSSELAHNVTLNDMNNMPLMNIGVSNQGYRDPFSAVRLIPGIRYSQAATSNTMVINGTGANSQQIRLDGATTGSLENNPNAVLNGATGQSQPSVDAIQEVSVQSSNYAAEFGTSGGAVISMVTKSGTNQFHGSAYDYFRNEGLDAHQPYTGNRNTIRQHDWGATFGGPVKIPKFYNGESKTFFFFNFEQYRNHTIVNTATSTVPTPAYLNGDFSNLILQENKTVSRASGAVTYGPTKATIPSGTIFDPASDANFTIGYRTPFPGNQIPKTQFDKTAQKILALVPGPLGANNAKGLAGTNYQAPIDESRISYIPSIKIDQNLGSKHRVSLYLQSTHTKTPRSATGVDNLPDTITASNNSFSIARTARFNWDYTATPRLLLHFGLGWNDIDFRLSTPVNNYDALTNLGLRQSSANNFPRLTVGSSGAAEGGMNSLGPTSNTFDFERRPSGNFSGTYVMGRHTFKAGAEYRLEKYPTYTLANTAGTYTFAAGYTAQTADLQSNPATNGFSGFALSSFMLGGFSNVTMAAPTTAATSKSQTSIYLQDNWKFSRKLTLDYGLRWDYGTYAAEQYGRYSSFSPTIANPSASGRLGARAFEATCKCHFADNYPYAIGPRIGAAYQLNRKTVIRAGIGIVYNQTGNASGGPVNTSFSSSPANFNGVLGLLQNGTPSNVNPVWPNFDPAAGQSAGSVVTMPYGLDPKAGHPSHLVQWNVTLQREITRDLIVEAAYVGNRGTGLEANGLATLNILSPSTLAAYGITDFTDANLGRILAANYPTGTSAQNVADRATLAQHGIYGLPYPNYPNSGQLVRNSLLPYPQFSGQNVQGAPLGNSWYDAFQLTVNKRYSHGLQVNFNYNYSKNLSLMSSPDPFNRALGKILDTFDLPQQARFTVLYQVPETRRLGTPILSNSVVSQVVSGWGIGLYLNYQSGSLLGQPQNNNTTSISQFLGHGPGPAQLMPGANPWSVDWTDYDGVHHTDPIDINCHCFDPTKNLVLNPAVWTNIPAGQYGQQQQAPRDYRSFRFPQENGNMSRNFRFGHEGRFNLNVRVEFQNVFNRMNLAGASFGTGNATNTATKFTSGANTGLYSAGFGTVNPTNGLSSARTGTFIARFSF